MCTTQKCVGENMAKKSVEGQMDLFDLFGSVEELEEKVKGVPAKLENQQAVMQKTFCNRVTKQTAVIAYLNYHKVYQKIWDEEPIVYQFEQSKDAVDYYVSQIGLFLDDKQIELLKEQETLMEAKVLPWTKE